MLSLKVFDRSHCEELVEAYRRATVLILEAIATRGRGGDESDLDELRVNLGDVISQLASSECKAPEVLVAAGAATMAIHEHNRHEVTAVRARAVELQAVVEMLTQTVSDVAACSDRSLSRLHQIERGLAKSQEIFDVRELRMQMVECLAAVREETACRKNESDRLVQDLQTAVRKQSSPLPAVAVSPIKPDSVEGRIKQATLEGRPVFVAVLLIDHLKTIAARFGDAAAAKVADFCVDQIKLHLQHVTHVARWKSVACVALLDGREGSEALERAVSTESQRHEALTLNLGQREVMVHVSYSKWTVFRVTGRPASGVLQSMNTFLASA